MARTRFEMVADDGAAPRDALIRDLDQSNTAYTALKLPSPVFYQPLNAGHEGAIIVGRTETITLNPGGRARTTGVFYDGEEDQAGAPRIWEMAREAVHMAREAAVIPSIDPTALAIAPNAEGDLALTIADFSGVTLVGMPAKVGTFVTFPDDQAPAEVEVDEDAPAPTAAEVRFMLDEDEPERAEAEASIRALIAAVVEAPPAELFGRPDIPPTFDGYRIEGNRIYGNLYPVDACHLGFPDQCVTAPESPSGYSLFRRYPLMTASGEIPVGRLTSGLGRIGTGCTCCDPGDVDDHACPNTKGLIAAMAHHDQMPVLADVNVGEHEGAIWVAGVLRPNLPAEAHDVLARRVWSGDWRPAGEADELVEILALHHGRPGFTARVRHGRTRSVLIAATGPAPEAPPVDEAKPEVDMPALVARTVYALNAVQTMNTAVADAAQARARADLTRLELNR